MSKKILTKLEQESTLSESDAIALLSEEVAPHAIGIAAAKRSHRINNGRIYYARNAHLNPTNVCSLACPLCAYRKSSLGELGSYELSIDSIVTYATLAKEVGINELHITGGIPPEKPASWFYDIVREIHKAAPRLRIKAWTAVEIDHIAKLEKCSVEEVLEKMMEAGLNELPGGGAEIFAPRVREEIAPRKIDSHRWLEIHRLAHKMNLPTNASVLFGHLETPKELVSHMASIRRLQDETDGFKSFIPLVFHPKNTKLEHLKKTSVTNTLRTIAVARLFLHNIPRIKAYWVTLTLPVAEIALHYGADDLEGTIMQEQIHLAAGANSTAGGISEDALKRMIVRAKRIPTLR